MKESYITVIDECYYSIANDCICKVDRVKYDIYIRIYERAMIYTLCRSSPPHVIVSTFACASRLVSEGHLPMDQLRFLIIDEADHIIKKHSKPFLTALLNKFVRQRRMYCKQTSFSFFCDFVGEY